MFTFFKRIKYPLDGYNKEVTNILSAFILRRVKIENAFVFQNVHLDSSSTPEVLSLKLYREVEHYISILIANDVVNPYKDWLLDFDVVDAYTKKKYVDGSEGIHHFFNITKDRRCDDWDSEKYMAMWKVNPQSLPAHIRPVTNLEFEIGENEKFREIRVIHPRFINQFTQDLQKVLESD